jgi:hypothetical protein
VRNANVKIKLTSFEMAAYFLNAAKHITLLESDAQLVDVYMMDKLLSGDKTELDEYKNEIRKEVRELNSEPYY